MEELTMPKHRLRHQPALQVRTTGIDLDGGLEGRRAWTAQAGVDVRMYDEDDDSDEDEEGLNNVFLRPKTGLSLDSAFRKPMSASARDVRESYSPQSFKERVMSSRGSKGLKAGEEAQGQGQSSEGTSSQRGSWMG